MSASQFSEAFEWATRSRPAEKQTWWHRNAAFVGLGGIVAALIGIGILIGKFIL